MLEDDHQSYSCLNRENQDKTIVQLYGCDSYWTQYRRNTDPCSCSDWEEDQRPQGDYEFREPQSKTCEISYNSQITEINERLDKICAKIEFYERYFGQTDDQDQDFQEVCSENCENQPEPTKLIKKSEPTSDSRSKSGKPPEKIEAKADKPAEPGSKSLPSTKPQVEKAKPHKPKQDEEKSNAVGSSVNLSSKEKAESDLCRYCCSRSSLKSMPSTCIQQCKAMLSTSEEKAKSDPVQAGARMKSSQDVPQEPKGSSISQPKTSRSSANDQMRCLPTTESKSKKSCTFLDDNEKTEDPYTKKASVVSVCCKCPSRSQTNVLKPIIKAESRSQPQLTDRLCHTCLSEAIERTPSKPINRGDVTCVNCCKPPLQKDPGVAKSSSGVCYVYEEERKVEAQEVCKKCCSESASQKQVEEESSDSVKDGSKGSRNEPQESLPPQRRKCTRCNKEYVSETARKIRSDLKEGLCDTCCLESILSRLTLRVEPEDDRADTSKRLPDQRRSSTGETEGMKADSSSRLQNETPDTDEGDKRLVDKEEQSDLEHEEPKKKRKFFSRGKKSD
nr:unnamed protein product [Callosobruchus chinensis]